MNAAELIVKKRNGQELTESELREFVMGYTREDVPDYQMAAFAMAVFFQGMSIDETVAFTRCMFESGACFTWPSGPPLVDKHSTGGIGDKVSLPLAPLIACCGVRVPMISGRGLGTTGGTLDKLDSIPGFRSNLSMNEFRSVVNWNGCCISGATPDLAPADRKMYALRDVTGTIPSIPLITGSILSKKIAEGIDTLVLDVKWGSGAFMKSLDEATELAETLVRVGTRLGLNVSAILSDMNQPLGNRIGNSLEVEESIELLQGNGPDDLKELTFALGSSLLCHSGVAESPEAARHKLQHAIDHKMAMEKFEEMVESQGGQLAKLPKPEFPHEIKAESAGWVTSIQTERLGLAIIEMGGGRKKMGDDLNYRVGIELHRKIGDFTEAGETLATLYCDSDVWKYAQELVLSSINLDKQQVPSPTLIGRSITTDA